MFRKAVFISLYINLIEGNEIIENASTNLSIGIVESPKIYQKEWSVV